jgi:signal peptidase I
MATENRKKKHGEKPKQWVRFGVVTVLYLLFLYWVESWWGLLVVPFIYDLYISHKINWGWWKDMESDSGRFIMSWVDAIVFALVVIYFLNLYFFQNFVIPSSSLEKSLLVGDYLCVSKVSYGPRIPETPLTLPLTQHTIPVLNCKSYSEWPHWEYRRVRGLGKVELNDIVVFNYPSGDSILVNPEYQNQDYYTLCYLYGESICRDAWGEKFPVIDSLTVLQQRALYDTFYKTGRDYMLQNNSEFWGVGYRPTDRRECYVKRCVGLPGQTLQIKNSIVYLDGKPNKEPDNVQYNYKVVFKNRFVSEDDEEWLHDQGVSLEALNELMKEGHMPLTKKAYEALKARTDLVESISRDTREESQGLYPHNIKTGWTRDNYGPVLIPKKGMVLDLTAPDILSKLPLYERCIKNYEHNDLQVAEDGTILINGKAAKSYTFKLDYYWMMGDNRHNSADSRYWGFVPEDHIVGKPKFIWLSLDPDRSIFNGGIRWNRLFNVVDNIK